MDIHETIESNLTLRYWGDPVLTTVCEPVRDTEFGSSLEKFAGKLVATMNTFKGIGLAAPQCGVPIRLFVMHFPECLVYDRSRKNGKLAVPPLAVCNPTIELQGGKVFGEEGCLSLPNVFSQVSRAPRVVMRYFTVLGVEKEIELHDMNARVAQHESDHLEGVIFIDRLASRQMRKAALREWEKQKAKLIF